MPERLVLDTLGKLHTYGYRLFGWCRDCQNKYDKRRRENPPTHFDIDVTSQHEAIIAELYKAVERLGGNCELLAIIGSWGDTLRDECPRPKRPSSRLTTRH